MDPPQPPRDTTARNMQESSGDDDDSSQSSGDGQPSFKQFQPQSRKFVRGTPMEGGQSSISAGSGSGVPQPPAPSASQNAPSAPRFEFINTTGPEQYSEADARTRARAHVMRQVHMEKDKERASRASGSGAGTRAQFGDMSLANLASEWVGEGGVRSPSVVPTGADRPADPSLLLAPMATPDSRRDNAAGAAYDPPQIQALRIEAEAGQAEPMGSVPQLPTLGGMEQRLIVPKTIGPGGFTVDLNAVERVRHCTQVFAQNSIPMSVEFETEWFSKALSDPACYHASMFISAAHRVRRFSLERNIPPEFYHHKGEAIRLINERLDDPQGRLADGTLASIACLAAFENMMGSEALASLHVDGLKRLVVMRGRLDDLGMAGLLETMILWVDMGNSLAVSRRPRFCPYTWFHSTSSEELTYQELLESQWQEWCLPALPTKQYPNFDEAMTRIFHRCRQLSEITLRDGSPISQTSCSPIYSTHSQILERFINASLWADVQNELRDADPNVGATSKTFHIAGFIYMYLALREIPTEVVIYNHMVSRLKGVLESLDQTRSFGGLDTGFLLWVLVVGGAAALGRPERSWFVTLFTRLRQVLQLTSWEEAKVTLAGYAWVENTFDTLSKGFWEESERMHEVVGMYRMA